MTEKNRLGDKLRDVEKGREDEYFARRDRELIEKARTEKSRDEEEALREAARERCPKCGHPLSERVLRGVTVDECTICKGMWLDQGELEKMGQDSWFGRWLRGERD